MRLNAFHPHSPGVLHRRTKQNYLYCTIGMAVAIVDKICETYLSLHPTICDGARQR